jgi:hypothetical protein
MKPLEAFPWESGIIETLKPRLFEVSRTNPETLAAAIIFLAGAAIGATASIS